MLDEIQLIPQSLILSVDEQGVSNHLSKVFKFHYQSQELIGSGMVNWWFGILGSKNFPTYPWNIPQTPNQQFMKEFLSFGGGRGSLGYAKQGYVGVPLDRGTPTVTPHPFH